MQTENKILLSRFMTRFGDQAWDFAVPLVLIELFPTNMRIAFIYFFTIKLGSVVLMPYVGRMIDKYPRRISLVFGIGIQAFAVLFTSVCIYFLQSLSISVFHSFFFYFLLFLGLISTLGANIMDIAVANDLVPTALPSERLPHFNSRLRQLDLATEVTSPILAGALLIITYANYNLFGFYLIAIWNILSFIPEYALLNQILHQHPQLNLKKIVPPNMRSGLIQRIASGWGTFIQQPTSFSIIAYSFLWLSVLSPHGVLLTAFLKGGWSLPEPIIGSFRAAGAILGLSATLLFPKLHKKFGLVKVSKLFILFQAGMIILAAISFLMEGISGKLFFLVFILLSRIGLYGFGLGETELRQRLIPESLRGEINGVGTSLNSLATLIIFGLGIIFSTPAQFQNLVLISSGAVVFAAMIFTLFAKRIPLKDCL